MTKQDTLRLLWDKYVRDQKLTASELRQLKDLIQDEDNSSLVSELLGSVYEQKQEISPEYSSSDAFNDMWEKLRQQPAQEAPVISFSSKRKWWRYAAAAAVLIAAGLGMYQFLMRDRPGAIAEQPPKVENISSEIQPGGNKAMLTLADGSVVALTDAQNGVLASQGSSNVVKLANGELAYQSNNKQENEVMFNTIVTPRGGKYRLTLPDGTKVWMNAESSLRYPTLFTGSTREVELNGEAYFEVARNVQQPFRVQVKDMKVEVLGTHFNIMAYENEAAMATTLVEGSVRVSSPSKQLLLKPGQQALAQNDGGMKMVNDVDVQQVLAWKNDYFQFNADPLDRLMRQIERWYDVSVRFDGTVPERKFGGKISRSSSLTDILKVLEFSDVKFRVEGKTITVINK
ncbi:FecR domain-containing protein [Terrimonas sp. NA20]|uniref:FecR domain-containing protein n=1 Tax=Terrimonas ginsenosidimutans TaxID=2908004 RepID=A0ABS9KLQ9_9BACT|nr:FecR family protein [Terrimonas ginsenosidimutans]MCG2613247.1 FecR domain-containing protein [Terrimonas ginsenosidimutans]